MFFGYYSRRVLMLSLTLSIFLVGWLQAQTGGLRGTIYDENSKDALPGANVIVQETSVGAATDLDGKFIVRGIPVGTQTIKISYLGYDSKSLTVDIAANRVLEMEFFLTPAALEGEEVIVTSQAQGQLEAINQQLASDNIANIISENRIQELPDFNAAASLSRLPGVSTTKSSGEDNKVVIRGLAPKYNSIEIEGVKLSATGSSSIGLTSDFFVTTDGVQNDRSVDLTMVSPYMIRMIEVYKSLTPDMNANSIGGTVNMELREAPSDLHYDLLWQSGYTAKSNTYGNYRAVASASNRFFDDKLGVYLLLNAESYDRNADNLNAVYDRAGDASTIDPETGYRPVTVTSVTFNRHIETRERYGGNLILDYNIPNGSFKFVNMLARLNSDYIDHNQNIRYNDGRLEWRLQIGENVIDQQMHSLKFDYDLGFLTANLSASYTSANNLLEDSPVINFNQVGGVFVQDRQNKKPEELNYLVDFGGNDNVVLRSGNMFSNDYQEDRYTFKGDFQIPYNLGTGLSGYVKFGGQFDDQSNITDQGAPYVAFDGNANSTDPDIADVMMIALQRDFGITLNSGGEFTGPAFINPDNEIFDSFLGDTYGDIYYSSNAGMLSNIMNYVIGNPRFDASNTNNQDATGNNGGWYDGPYQQLTNDYKFNQNYYAAYGMTKINFLDFMIIGGVRYEKMKSDFLAYNARDLRNVRIQKMYDTTSINENDFLLPMGQIKYSPFDWMDIRYAYTQTISRPDYQHLSPKFTITQTNQVYTGNPELKPAEAFNHDVNITFHTNEIGLLTIGGFYKTIENFVFNAEYRLDAAQDAGIDSLRRYQVWRDENGDGVLEPVVNPVRTDANVHRPLNNPFDAIVKGLELDFQHNFWYLPAPFNNMVFGVNYARIYSETRYPYYDVTSVGRPPVAVLIDSSNAGRLTDQPNHVLNTYIGYDYEGFSARLSFLYQDNSARTTGNKYPENDSNTKEYFRMDFSARQKLPWFNSELFLDINNLNDENNSWVQNSIGGFEGIRNYGLLANLGIRIRY